MRASFVCVGLGLLSPASAQAEPLPDRHDWLWEPRYRLPADGFGVVADPLRRCVVQFGGGDPASRRGMRLFEWDGARWELIRSRDGPPPLVDPIMAWDPANEEVLLCGGLAFPGGTDHADTWTWDGRRWRHWPDAGGPPFRWGEAAADPLRGVVVVVGGGSGSPWPLAETWEWNGSVWQQRLPANRPRARVTAGMAWCGNIRQVVLFGGRLAVPVPNDVWAWDGTDWTQFPARPGDPVARASFGFCETDRGTVVLHGGNDSSRRFNDTWEWDGSGWRQLPNQGAPPAYLYNSLVWDPTNSAVLHRGPPLPFTSLLGPNGWTQVWEDESRLTPITVAYDSDRDVRVVLGLSANFLQCTTYEIDAEDRFRRVFGPIPGQAPRSDGGGNFVYHRADRVCVYFAGGAFQDETWLWDGRMWTQDTRQPRPPTGTTYHCYDRTRHKMVVLSPPPGMQHWEYDVAGGWVQRHPPALPAVDRGLHMTWSGLNGNLVLVGWRAGTAGSTTSAVLDTWEYDGRTWARQPVSIPGFQTLVGSGGTIAYSEQMQAVVRISRDVHSGNLLFDRSVRIQCYDHSRWYEPSVEPLPLTSPSLMGGPIAVDRHGALDFFFLQDGTIYERLSFQTMVPDQTRYRPGETARYDVTLPEPGGVFVPAWSFGRQGVDLHALGVPVTDRAAQGVVPLDPDALFWLTAGSRLALPDVHGRSTVTLPIPNHPAVKGWRLHGSGVRFVAGRVDWIATPTWIEIL